jgi:hypothetical protein
VVEVLAAGLTWQEQQHSRAILEVGLTTMEAPILHLEAPLVHLDNQAQRPR